jgi:hypothetical protein
MALIGNPTKPVLLNSGARVMMALNNFSITW